MSIIIYHNPRCSKSRQTLALLDEQNIEPEIIEYLTNPPDASQLRNLVTKLGLPVRDIMRSNEAPYKELGLADPDKSEDELIDAIVENPILLQRPIVVAGDEAAIGRPPENVLSIL